MNEYNLYRTGRDDLKMDIQKRITELKSAAWDAEHEKKYTTLLAMYRDLIGLLGALNAIYAAENEELAWLLDNNNAKKNIPEYSCPET